MILSILHWFLIDFPGRTWLLVVGTLKWQEGGGGRGEGRKREKRDRDGRNK